MVDDDCDNAIKLKLEKLKCLRENIVDWEIEEQRHEFLCRVDPLIETWKKRLPDLRDIFRPEEIELLLMDSVKRYKYECGRISQEERFVEFVTRSGYKNEPDIGEDGKPIWRRTTPLHHATSDAVIAPLFEIYNRYDVNYADESGLTHFHVACMYNNAYIDEFIELGQDPNLLVRETGDSPLHLSLAFSTDDDENYATHRLLDMGANPNLSNREGMTPLHVICKKHLDNIEAAKILFQHSDKSNQPLQIDAKDRLGRTPLQWAVVSCLSDTVKFLMDRGADVSSFVFPTETHFADGLEMLIRAYREDQFKDSLPIDLMRIVNYLEEREYEFDQIAASTIMKIFAQYGLLKQTPGLDEYLRSNEKFVKWAKEIMVKPSLPLYDLLQLRPEKAAKLLTCTDYLELCNKSPYEIEPKLQDAYVVHLLEIKLRGIFQPWALDFMLELTHYQLPILCCDKIIEKLMSEDLWRIYLAVTGQNL